MKTYFLVTADAAPTVAAKSTPCATINDALTLDNFMLGNGAPSVWTVDSEGHVVLPPEQGSVKSSGLPGAQVS